VNREPVSIDVDAPASRKGAQRGNMGEGGAWGKLDHTDQCWVSILCFQWTNLYSPWIIPTLVHNMYRFHITLTAWRQLNWT